MKTKLVFPLVLALALPVCLVAAVSDEDFQKLQQQFQELQKQREQDRKEIDHLKEKLGETEKTASEAQKTASEAATKAQQPIIPVPSEEAAAKQNFLVTGYAHALYDKTEGENGSFLLGSFSPIFLFRASDKVLFEGELELELGRAESGETETEVGIEYAQIDYAVSDYLTVIAGRFILPLGAFNEKIHPAWINKLPTAPLPYRGHDAAIMPFNDIGVQGRGAVHLGQSDAVLNYAGYIVNGPNSELEDDGMGGTEEHLHFGSGVDLNSTPSGGGRLGLFYPWKAYQDVEVGVSGQTGTWNRDGNLMWSAIVVDAALHLDPYTELRGEYIQTFQETAGEGTRNPRGAWAQVAYKLAGLQLELPMINNCEALFRWSYLDTDMAGTRTHGYALGLNYYLSNTLLVKGAYEFITSNEASEENNRLTFQIAYGF